MRRPLLLLSCFCLAATWAASCPPTLHAEGIADYQAIDWNQGMILPPGAYRAPKPIELHGDFTVKTQANTQIDGVQFYARDGVQHWHIEGTSLRQVAITGKRNSSGHGIDSTFEDCSFNKDDNWYNFWWSTRWNFDNCIFTKKFLRGDLPPLDYSAHASRCTFYSVKLPPVGFKEDPAKYMGKNDLVFERCRFVDCDVPQTFLASTVDCVFEHCRFEPKNKVNWPKDSGVIKVAAYYTGDSEPASFTNGPFSVAFQREPLGGGGRGSTVPHTISGGRITLTNLRLSGAISGLGTSPLKASQLAEAAVTAALISSSAPIPALSSAAISPRQTGLAPAVAILDGSNPAAFVGSWMAIALKSTYSVERLINADRSVVTDGRRSGSWEIKDNRFLVRYDEGGGVDAFDLPVRNGTMLGKNLNGAPLSLTQKGTLAAPALRAQIAGTWDRTEIEDNSRTSVTLNANGDYLSDGVKSAHWEVYGNLLLIAYDNHPDWHDLFELPGANATLAGLNHLQHTLKLVRQDSTPSAAGTGAVKDPGYFGTSRP